MRNLDPAIRKAREFLERALQAAGKTPGLLRERIEPVKKRLEPAARRLESAAAKLKAWFKRDPRRPWLAVLVLLALVFAAAFSGSGPRYYRAAFASGRTAPLPDQQRQAVREMASELALTLDSGVDKKGRFGKAAQTSAQVLLALGQGDPRYAKKVDSGLMENFFRSVAGPECACWRKSPRGRHPANVAITSWVLWNLAAYGIPAQKGEIGFLLSSQDRRGWWPMFAGATRKEFASTYGTAAAIVALQAQSALEADEAQRGRLMKAALRGAAWLQGQVVAGKARWADYPAWPEEAERKMFLGVSGFVVFALHRVGAPGLAELDRDWLGNLPAEIPAAERTDASGKAIRTGRRSYMDDTRYCGLPWGILATVLAYQNASIGGKVRAIEWLERALAPGTSLYDVVGTRDDDLAAEVLFALRNYPEVTSKD